MRRGALNSYKETKVTTATQSKLIIMLYDEVIKQIDIASDAINNRKAKDVSHNAFVKSQDCISELDLLKPKIMDSILGLLSSKRYKEIAGCEGKQRLKYEIAVSLNSYLTKGQVRKVYFTEFLIQ